MSSSSFYQPIGQNSIRLLRLEGTCLAGSGSGPKDLAIQCSLHEYPFDQARDSQVAYRALSYVWGSPRFVRPIVCNGVATTVTENLYAALSRLTFDETFDALLWCDALCINQADEVEKAFQVSMMGAIYERAELVIVWLGSATGISGSDFESYWEYMAHGPYFGHLMEAEHRLRIEQFEWFSRVWTMPEIVLAREAEVRYGPHKIDWDTFSHRAASLKVYDICKFRYKRQPPLSNLLLAAKQRKATIEHDLVYAVRSLWHGRAALEVNYELSIPQIMAKAVVEIAREEGWLWLNMSKVAPLKFWTLENGNSGFMWTKQQGLPFSWISDLKAGSTAGPAGDYTIIHESLNPDARLDKHVLIIRGAILGVWSSYEDDAYANRDYGFRSGTNGWQYGTRLGKFTRFPLCIEDSTTLTTPRGAHCAENFFAEGEDPQCFEPTDIYNRLQQHIHGACSCIGDTVGVELDASTQIDQGWLCLLFGARTPVVLVPRIGSTCGRLHFELHDFLDLKEKRFGSAFRRFDKERERSSRRESPLIYCWTSEADWVRDSGKWRYEDGPLSFIPTTFEIIGDVDKWVGHGDCGMASHAADSTVSQSSDLADSRV